MATFSKRALTSQVSAIKRIAAAAAADPTVISLSQGIPSFSTPEHVRKGVAKALVEDEPGIGRYSMYMGLPKLRKLVAEKLSREWKKEVNKDDNLFISAGSMEGLLAVILAIVNPGEEVIVPVPDYGPHFQHIHLAGAKAVVVPMIEEKNWHLEIEGVEKAITKRTKAIILTNPGNPLGQVFDRDTLQEIARIAKEADLWVLVDETYSYLTYDDIEFVSAATIEELTDRVIVTRTFSKEYAMTGWRLGYVYGPRQLIKQALKMHDPMVIAAATVSQKAGILALEGDQQVVEEMKSKLAERRRLFCNLLDGFSPHITYVKPKGAYYVFAKISQQILDKLGPSSEEFAMRMLKEAKVAVVPGSEFRPPEDVYIRFSFAGEEAQFEEAMERIRKWLLANLSQLSI